MAVGFGMAMACHGYDLLPSQIALRRHGPTSSALSLLIKRHPISVILSRAFGCSLLMSMFCCLQILWSHVISGSPDWLQNIANLFRIVDHCLQTSCILYYHVLSCCLSGSPWEVWPEQWWPGAKRDWTRLSATWLTWLWGPERVKRKRITANPSEGVSSTM